MRADCQQFQKRYVEYPGQSPSQVMVPIVILGKLGVKPGAVYKNCEQRDSLHLALFSIIAAHPLLTKKVLVADSYCLMHKGPCNARSMVD